jgi:hypothetical protein
LLGVTYWQVPAWGPITVIEAIWLIAGVAAALLAAFQSVALGRDRRLASVRDDPLLSVVAGAPLRREVVRLTQALCIVGLGVYAAQEGPGPAGAIITVVGLVLTSVLFVIAFLGAVNSFLDKRDRDRVLSLLEEK